MLGAGQAIQGYGAIGGGSSANVTPSTQRVSAIPAQLATLEKGHDMLHQIIGALEERLGTVLRPTPPDAPGHGPEKALDESGGVGLAMRLQQSNHVLHNAYGRLSAILNRIEL